MQTNLKIDETYKKSSNGFFEWIIHKEQRQFSSFIDGQLKDESRSES